MTSKDDLWTVLLVIFVIVVLVFGYVFMAAWTAAIVTNNYDAESELLSVDLAFIAVSWPITLPIVTGVVIYEILTEESE